MLRHPTIDKLNDMRLIGMARSLQTQLNDDHIHQLSFDERFGLLVDDEHTDRLNRGNCQGICRLGGLTHAALSKLTCL